MPEHKWEFTHSPLKNAFHLQDIENDLLLQAALKNDLTATFWKDVRWRLGEQKKSENAGKNINVFIKGEQGSGKSTIAQVIASVIAKEYGRPMNADDVCFTHSALFERMKTAKRFDTIINDEAKDFMTQIGSSRKREQLDFIEQTLRAQGINLLQCGLRPQGAVTFNFLLWAFDVDYAAGINRAILYDVEGEGAGSYIPRGYLLFDRHVIPKDFESAYVFKKMAFTKAVKEGANRNVQQEIDAHALELCKEYAYFAEKGTGNVNFVTQAARRKYPEMAESEVREVARAALFLRIQKKADSKQTADEDISDSTLFSDG